MRVLHLVAADLPTSVPIEMISHMTPVKRETEIKLIAFYKFQDKPNNGFIKVDDYVGFRKLWPLSGIKRLYRLIKAFQPDVLHLHHGLSAFLGAMIGKYLGIRLIIKTEHRSHQINRIHARFLTTATFLCCDQIICNSLSTLNSFSRLDRAITSDHALVIYNGIDPHLIEQTWANYARDARETQPFTIASTTRLISKKNTSTLLQAFAQLTGRYSDLRLKIVGDGPERRVLEEQAESLGIRDLVEFTGLVTRREVFEVISRADLFCLIPLSEGFCNALIEAMVARCPVVASNIPAIREVTGLSDNVLVSPKEVDQVVSGLEGFLAMSASERAEIGERNHHFAVDRYSLRKAASKHLKLYDDLLGS